MNAADSVRWNSDGLVPVIAQEQNSLMVLMMAWMNRAALDETLRTGELVYYSRSRQRLWRKGETSGHRQKLISLRMDCDEDVLLANVEQVGGIACHTGRKSCFYRQWRDDQWQEVDPVLTDPNEIYRKS